MRYVDKEYFKEKPIDYGKERIRSGFLFFPMSIHGEGRWLEYARWTEERGYYIWYPTKWIDGEQNDI